MKSAQYISQKKIKKYPDSIQGFTLLELMISMTIIAMIMLIVYASLRISINSWEKGEKKMLSSQQYRIVLNLIQTQLASLYSDSIINGEKKIYFKGDETSLEFLSGVSMVPGNKYGIVYVRYQVSSDQNSKKMSFYEKNITHISDSINLHDVKSDDFYELFPEIHEFGFEYLKEYTDADILENQLQWQKTWDPDIDKGFPRAVRIGFQETEQSHPVYIVIPIKKEIIS
ncbi:Prepilin-type N-terminal cleavage/methylation domain-containing protein [Desulfonema limicola]|uniref:Prepilin-type N-terminal cleavage/methylation domain-containing protein n=1 Tax=Desulfonema limicola TaxID=45656 RepID=A0A975B8E0_9BACT|nr:prepilin-type N-terminal cleavage/methylation domain-containing protein [Desulfonema limicola]QTA80618.1 Prepilin-type N-terminal cleavage/methylation domain-containing protein [Desulfonema limicola]